jgi:hypothetical protein
MGKVQSVGGNHCSKRAWVTVANKAKLAALLLVHKHTCALTTDIFLFHNAHIESISREDTIPGAPEAGSNKQRLPARVPTRCR